MSAMKVKSEGSSLNWFTGVKSKTTFVDLRPVVVSVEDHEYYLFGALKAIAIQINDAKEILHYNYDWDDEGALPTSPQVFHNAINFLVSYSNFIFRRFDDAIIATPYIDILKDGGVSILWDTPKARFLIFFKNSASSYAYFFAEKTDTKIPFKSAIEINAPVDESIASWMKANLSI